MAHLKTLLRTGRAHTKKWMLSWGSAQFSKSIIHPSKIKFFPKNKLAPGPKTTRPWHEEFPASSTSQSDGPDWRNDANQSHPFNSEFGARTSPRFNRESKSVSDPESPISAAAFSGGLGGDGEGGRPQPLPQPLHASPPEARARAHVPPLVCLISFFFYYIYVYIFVFWLLSSWLICIFLTCFLSLELPSRPLFLPCNHLICRFVVHVQLLTNTYIEPRIVLNRDLI